MLARGARPVTAALRVMGLSGTRHVTNDHRVVNWASGSLRPAGRLLWGWLMTSLMPPGATLVLGADDTVDRRLGRRITAKGCDRDAGRSSKPHVIRGVGLPWVSLLLLVPLPCSQRVWAWPLLTALGWPVQQGGRRWHKTRIGWVRHMMPQVRRWRPGQRLVLVVDGGVAAVSRALACVTHHVVMVSRLRRDAALYHPPAPGKRGHKPTKEQPASLGERPRYPLGDRGSELGWRPTEHSVGLLAYSPVVHPGPVPGRHSLCVGAGPGGETVPGTFFCTDLRATPVEILPWVVRDWSVEVTFEEARAHLGVETHRQWSDRAIARTAPVLLGVFSLVTVLALQWRQDGQIPVLVSAWYHTAEPTFADCLALGRQHLWRAQYVMNSGAEPEFVQFPRAALDLLLTGLPLAA
jgi:hypothetical protein